MMTALSVSNLSKIYKGEHKALDGVSLKVASGDFFALLGPNGAGKSTLIGIVSSLVNKTSGDVEVFGKSLEKNIFALKRHIGVVPQEFNFNIYEPIIEIIINQAGFYGIGPVQARQRAEHYLKKLDLWGKRDVPANTLSGGMKRRLMIARALVHEPKLLILDEPTAGVDIEVRHAVWAFLKEINTQGTTVILTTHYLEEAENLCKHLAIIDEGKIIQQGRVDDLVAKAPQQTYIFDLSQNAYEAAERIRHLIHANVIDEQKLEVTLDQCCTLKDIFTAFSQHDVAVSSMKNKLNRLEEVFLNLVKAA